MTAIRPLDLSNIDVAEEIWAMQHAAYRHESALVGEAGLPPLRETVASLQRSPETFYGRYTEDGELAGAVSVSEAEGRMTIRRMMVDPAYFRQGIATSLLEHVTEVAYPGRDWTVDAEARNVPAIRLYERNGFERAGVWHPSPGLTMARMTKRASSPNP